MYVFTRKRNKQLFPKYLFFCPFCEYSKLLHGFEDHRKLIKKYWKKGEDAFFKKSFCFFCIKDNIKKIASKNISVHRHSQQINIHTIKISKNEIWWKNNFFYQVYYKNKFEYFGKKQKKRYSSNKNYCTLSKKTAKIYIES